MTHNTARIAFEAFKECTQPSFCQRGHSTEAVRIPLGVAGIDACLDGGLIQNALHEVRCSHTRDIGAAWGFVGGLIVRLQDDCTRKIVWITDPAASVDSGMLFPDGLAQYGLDPERLTIITPLDQQNAMWATDEAAGCGNLAAIVFQMKGNPQRFNMTATRRLMLRARESGVFVCVLRQSGEAEASAAATRWHIGIQPSQPDEDYQQGLGRMRHILTLEKNRHGQTGQWLVSWNPKDKAFENAAQNNPIHDISTTHSSHRLSIFSNRPDRPAQMGKVMDFG
ncbi:MAG: hypothetical protein K8F25_16940 [Fimbriimonadaceae bacterium]|nr:hypothetical protein [Alphaproteobacteria bacterium]